MSFEAFEQVIGRALLDEAFRARLLSDPADAAQGYDLTAEELAALGQLRPGNFRRRNDGAIHTADYDGNIVSTLDFYHGLISEMGFPALDGASKNDDGSLPVRDDSLRRMPIEMYDEKIKFSYGDGEFDPGGDSQSSSDQGSGHSRKVRQGRLLALAAAALVVVILGGVYYLGPFHLGGNPLGGGGTSAPAAQPTGFCSAACTAGSDCQKGLVCAAGADGSSACTRNGHCGCGVACDPDVANSCDAGLKCTLRGSATVCWAGGCEDAAVGAATQPLVSTEPTCQVVQNDGTCSACEDASSDPQDCSQPGKPDKSGGGGSSCKCVKTDPCLPKSSCPTKVNSCTGNPC